MGVRERQRERDGSTVSPIWRAVLRALPNDVVYVYACMCVCVRVRAYMCVCARVCVFGRHCQMTVAIIRGVCVRVYVHPYR